MSTEQVSFTPDYKIIGSNIQHDYDHHQRGVFWERHWQSTDKHMATLACYARFLWNADRHRAAGREEDAKVQEANAQTVFEREIDPKYRW